MYLCMCVFIGLCASPVLVHTVHTHTHTGRSVAGEETACRIACSWQRTPEFVNHYRSLLSAPSWTLHYCFFLSFSSQVTLEPRFLFSFPRSGFAPLTQNLCGLYARLDGHPGPRSDNLYPSDLPLPVVLSNFLRLELHDWLFLIF